MPCDVAPAGEDATCLFSIAADRRGGRVRRRGDSPFWGEAPCRERWLCGVLTPWSRTPIALRRHECPRDGERNDHVDGGTPAVQAQRTPARRVAHLSPEERVARGKAAPQRHPQEQSRSVATSGQPPGPDRAAGGTGGEQSSRARSAALRADDGLAVHLLPRGRVDHGVRFGGHPPLGPDCRRSVVMLTCRTSACSPPRSGS